MTALASLTAWLGPALLASVAVLSFRGDPQAPLVVLLVVAAPLLALLRRSDTAAPDRGRLLLAAPGLVLLLGASFLTLVEVASMLGIAPARATLAAGVLALIPLVVGGVEDDWSGVISACGVGGAAVVVVMVAAAIGLAPWTAWSQSASRPAVVFHDSSVWVTQGSVLAKATTLDFTEAQRVTAMSGGTYRLIERDGGAPTVRDRQLNGGEAMTLRPGDGLLAEPGARLRFEAGKRIPGQTPSGVSWSRPRPSNRAHAAVQSAGLAVSVLGAALGLIAPCRTRGLAIGGPVTLVVFALSGAAWGVYAMYAGADLSIGAGPLTALVQLPPIVVDAGFAPTLVMLMGVAMLALFTAMSCGLARHMRDAAAPWTGARLAPLAWAAAVLVAAAASWLAAVDPWTLLVLGCGFLATTVGAPALASDHAGGRRIGGMAGAVAFAVVAVALAVRGGSLGVASIALVAAPLAWLTTTLAARRM